MRDLPKLFHIGTQKAGSTFLYNMLAGHPDAGLSSITEVGYYRKSNEVSQKWYMETFSEDPKKVLIDTSPSYFINGGLCAPGIESKVGDKNPLFLLILRNPIDYVNSHFRMHLLHGYFKRNSETYPERTKDLVKFVSVYPEYLNRALYADNLKRNWLSIFKREQFHIVVFEEFIKNPALVLKEILRFWGLKEMDLTATTVSKNKALRGPLLHRLSYEVSKHPGLKSKLKNSRSFGKLYDNVLTKDSKGSLSKADRAELMKYFDKDVAVLGSEIGVDTSLWVDFSNHE